VGNVQGSDVDVDLGLDGAAACVEAGFPGEELAGCSWVLVSDSGAGACAS
jgi:hypothetical protein